MDIETLFATDGLLSRRLPDYRYSRQHVEMAYAVADALHAPHHLAVEAQPGLGRGLAYLLPAVQRIESGARRGLISTHTPALRRRILEQDIPLLQAALPTEFSAAQVEPRHQYIGMRRLDEVAERRRMLFGEPQDLSDLDTVEAWVTRTTDGALGDFANPPRLGLWDRIKSEHGNCMGHRCQRYQDCFFHAALRRSQHAQLLVVSHAVLLNDLSRRQRGMSLLPDYDFVVVDEAHALREAATEHGGVRLSDHQVALLMDILYDPRSGRGFLAACHSEAAVEAVADVREAARAFFGALRAWLQLRGGRLVRCHEPPCIHNPLSPALRRLQVRLRLVRDQLTREEDLFELTSYIERCTALADLLEELLGQERAGLAYWLESELDADQRPHLCLQAAPLTVDGWLERALFGQVGTVVLTSSSLSMHRSDTNFAYVRRSMGMSGGYSLRLEPGAEDSKPPEFLVESHLPVPDLEAQFLGASCLCIAEHLTHEHGPALIIAPNWDALDAIAAHLAAQNPQLDLAIVGRDHQHAAAPAARFAATHATDTTLVTCDLLDELEPLVPIWRTIIVVRLPFEPRDAPLTAARVDAIHDRGGHAFREYQLPEAILRFKQCVRSAFHPNVGQARIVVLDQRILTRGYGREFLDALAACRPKVRHSPYAAFEPLYADLPPTLDVRKPETAAHKKTGDPTNGAACSGL